MYSNNYWWLPPFLARTLQIDDLEHKLKELHHSTAMSLEEASSAASEQISTLKLAPVCPTTHFMTITTSSSWDMSKHSLLRVYKIASVKYTHRYFGSENSQMITRQHNVILVHLSLATLYEPLL